jgi:glycosyltransferase involved in cell wall biosynthesis
MRAISIIICTRNRAAILARTLDAVIGVLPPNQPGIEIIVVDNGSTDNTPEIVAKFAASRPGVKYVHEAKRGKSSALNRGARESTGDILVWLDDDVIPKAGWLEGLVQPILEDKADFVVGRIDLAPHLLRDWMTPELRQRYGEIPGAKGDTFPVGGNTALTRAFYAKSEGHDPELGPGSGGLANGEDILFSRQMVALGARLGYAEDGAVEHHFEPSRLTRKAWLETAEGQGRASAYIYHHWDHATTSMPMIRKWYKQAQLFAWRLLHRPNLDPESEGASTDELAMVHIIGFLDQYAIESRKPHKYKKHGTNRQPGAAT